MDDANLIDRIREGDKAALGELYDRYATVVKVVAIRLVGVDGADDIVQEVFIKVWQKPWSIDVNKGALGAYLVRIARNQSIDSLRKTDRVSPVGPEIMESNGESYEQSFLLDVEPEVLKELSKEERAIVRLTFYSDLTQAQIAKELDIPLGTVKSRMHAAAAKMRKYYGV